MAGFQIIKSFSKATIIKEVEDYWFFNEICKNKVEKFELALRKFFIKRKNSWQSFFLIIIRENKENFANKRENMRNIIKISKNLEKFWMKKSYFKWVTKSNHIFQYQKGIFKLTSLLLTNLGLHTLKLLKMNIYLKKLRILRFTKVLKFLLKKSSKAELLSFYTKWSQMAYNSIAKKKNSSKIYKSLGKSIVSVISHKQKSNLKWSFSILFHISNTKKIVRKYKNPLLYFTTVVSKILCRYKFSTFTSIQRVKEKTNRTMNLHFSDKLNTLWYILSNKYFQRLEEFFGLNKKFDNFLVFENDDQVLTFFNKIDNQPNVFEGDNLPKLQLEDLGKAKKPPASGRRPMKIKGFKAAKVLSRTGSYGGSLCREDSLTRRKNYDAQLKKKQKNFEKFAKCEEEYKETKLLNKIKPKKPKFIEIKKRDHVARPDQSDFSLKISLGVLSLKRFYDRSFYNKTRSAFKDIKDFYNYTKSSNQRYLRHFSEKYL